MLGGFPEQVQDEVAVLVALEPVGTAAHEALELAGVLRIGVERDLARQLVHRYPAFGVKQHQRLDLEAHREVLVIPDGPGVLAGADYLQRPNPAHHAREVAQQNIAGLDVTGEIAPALGKAANGGAGLAKLLPGCAGEQIEPVAHEVFVLIW